MRTDEQEIQFGLERLTVCMRDRPGADLAGAIAFLLGDPNAVAFNGVSADLLLGVFSPAIRKQAKVLIALAARDEPEGEA